MANPAKFDRCVKKVRARSKGRVNAYAVCTAAGMRKPNARLYFTVSTPQGSIQVITLLKPMPKRRPRLSLWTKPVK